LKKKKHRGKKKFKKGDVERKKERKKNRFPKAKKGF